MTYVGNINPTTKDSETPLLVTITGRSVPARATVLLGAERVGSDSDFCEATLYGGRSPGLAVRPGCIQAEAKGPTFGRPYKGRFQKAHPIVIGVFQFPSPGEMVLSVRSVDRAIAAARFFGPRFGSP